MSCLLLAEEAVSVSCWEKLDIIFSIIGVVATIILTIFIIKQTHDTSNLSDKTAKDIAAIEDRNAQLQLKLSQREDYKIAFKTFVSCFLLCEYIDFLWNDIIKQSIDEIIVSFEKIKQRNKSAMHIQEDLYFCEWCMPCCAKDTVKMIRTAYREILDDMAHFSLLKFNAFSDKERDEARKDLLGRIKVNVKTILGTKEYVVDIIEKNISLN